MVLAQGHVLDPGARGDALALELGHGLDRAVLGHQELLEHVLGVARVGGEDLEQARLRDLADRQVGRAGAVGAAVGAAREHRFHHLLRAGELERLDVEAGLLEVALLDRGEERQAGRDRPEADPDLRRRLRAGAAARRARRWRCRRRRRRRACAAGDRWRRSRARRSVREVMAVLVDEDVRACDHTPGVASADEDRLARYARQPP